MEKFPGRLIFARARPLAWRTVAALLIFAALLVLAKVAMGAVAAGEVVAEGGAGSVGLLI